MKTSSMLFLVLVANTACHSHTKQDVNYMLGGAALVASGALAAYAVTETPDDSLQEMVTCAFACPIAAAFIVSGSFLFLGGIARTTLR